MQLEDSDSLTVCIKCKEHQIRSVLVQELIVAAEHGKDAEESSAARREMIKAHSRLDGFLNQGIVPADLKQTI